MARAPSAGPVQAERASVRAQTGPAPGGEGRARIDGADRTALIGRRSRRNLARHAFRATSRVVALLVADLATFYVARFLVRAVRDQHALGEFLARAAASVVPPGLLNGWRFALALVLGLLVTGNYGQGDRRHSAERLFWGCMLATALVLWSDLWTLGVGVVAEQFVAVTVGLACALFAERELLQRLRLQLFPPARSERVLFVGSAEDCERERRAPAFTLARAYRDLGFVDLDLPHDARAAGSIDDLERVVHRLRVDTVVLCGAIQDDHLQRVVDAVRAGSCRLLAVPIFWDVAGVQPLLIWREGQALLELASPEVRVPELLAKRLLDVCGAAVGLLAISPLLVVIGVLIRLESRGPVFFGSERWGRGGRCIRIWKFRTMVADALLLLGGDPQLKAEFDQDAKLKDDPRVTRVGRFLRRWSLDELPQLINVLLGEMSLVGPRPKLVGEEDKYGAMFGLVLSVPPGLTGLWQVSGRNNLSYEERVALDVDYVRRCSIWLDFKILVQTVPAVLLGVGAR